ncbi:MAG: type I glyceraldehyde-3-phosphate dehydrogenase [Deltaproteobacteria bacterium]|nr:type I glyceraldehyde-3-phosphate dehydrogenase [Deltaproteobacteria bacterium]
MTVRVGINGFGRIGRLVFRAAAASRDLEIIAVNDLTDAETLGHLLKYDSTYGHYQGKIETKGGAIVVDGHEVKVLAVREPKKLPWKDLGVEVVLESTGRFRDRESASKHLEAGAKKVVISAPAKDPDKTLVLGVNEKEYDREAHHILSMGSCTTNCLAPIAKVLNDEFGIEHGLMTTAHAYTNDQVILDFPHKDLRRARAAGLSMIPTTTGAAVAISLVIPELKGRLDGMAIRVPTPTVSVVDLVCSLKTSVTVDSVNGAFRKYADGSMKGILAVSDEPLVSRDYTGSTYSSIVDALSTKVVGGNLVKVISWYDNEWGFSTRMAEFLAYISM